MATFNDGLDGIARLIKDSGGRVKLTELTGILQDAVRRFQRRVPRVIVKEVAGDGGFDYALPSDYVDGFSTIRKLFYPFDSIDREPEELEPKEYRVFRREAGPKLRFLTVTPAADKKYLIEFTAPHTADPAGVDTVSTLSASGTTVSAGAQDSQAADVEDAADARIFFEVLTGVGTLDVFVQARPEDGHPFVDIDQFNQFAGPGKQVLPLAKHKVSKGLRLRYVATGGPFTVKAMVEREQTGAGTLTVLDAHLDVLSFLGASLAARALANFYAGVKNSELSGDTTDYEGKSAFWAARADEWKTEYDEQVATLSPVDTAPAFAQGEWDMRDVFGDALMLHPEETR